MADKAQFMWFGIMFPVHILGKVNIFKQHEIKTRPLFVSICFYFSLFFVDNQICNMFFWNSEITIGVHLRKTVEVLKCVFDKFKCGDQ